MTDDLLDRAAKALWAAWLTYAAILPRDHPLRLPEAVYWDDLSDAERKFLKTLAAGAYRGFLAGTTDASSATAVDGPWKPLRR